MSNVRTTLVPGKKKVPFEKKSVFGHLQGKLYRRNQHENRLVAARKIARA